MYSHVALLLSVGTAAIAQSHELQLPTIHWPVHHSYRQIFPERPVILEPRDATLPETRWNALLIYCDGRIEARDPPTGRALWPKPVVCRNQPQFLGAAAGRFVFATPHRLFALNPSSGRLSWQFGEEPPEDPAEDPESRRAWTCFAMNASRIFAADDGRELFALGAEEGAVLWKIRLKANVHGPLVANEGFVCFVEGAIKDRVAVLDARTGDNIGAAHLEGDAAVQSLLLPSDNLLVVMLSKTIHAFDLTRTIRKRWSADCFDLFRAATLKTQRSGLFVSGDGRSVSKYDLKTGQRLWTTAAVGDARVQDEVWIDVSANKVLATRADTFVILDPESGEVLNFASAPGGFKSWRPTLTADSAIILSPQFGCLGKTTTRPSSPSSDYWLSLLSYSEGPKELAVGLGWNPLPVSMKSFVGLFVRDDALILLDGYELIGYSARKEKTTKPAD